MPFRSLLLAIFLLFVSLTPALADDNPTPRTHIVVAGDTLLAISQQYGASVDEIMAANGLDNPNLIYIGQRLAIPVAGETDAEETHAPLQLSRSYSVRPGDTITRLARRFGVSTDQILSLNGISRREARRFLLLEPEILVPLVDFADFPAPFRSLSFTPAIVQGQTGVVLVTLDEKTPPTGKYRGLKLNFYGLDETPDGQRYEALIPTGALASPGPRLLAVQADGQRIRIVLPIQAGEYETQYIVLPPSKGGLLEPKKVRSELEILQEVWSKKSPDRLWQGPFRFPIAPGFQQTSPFGARRSYNHGPVRSYHAGVDWSAPAGTPIVAPADGIVALAEDLVVRGGAVVIDHGQGVFSNFWHQSQILVEPGQAVKRGETIGLVGTTGLSTGAHLHWEIRVDGIAVDPMQWADVNFPYDPTLVQFE
jgi:murein DD-endopeptidase MepM/ murein hydrolase activator NlpD